MGQLLGLAEYLAGKGIEHQAVIERRAANDGRREHVGAHAPALAFDGKGA